MEGQREAIFRNSQAIDYEAQIVSLDGHPFIDGYETGHSYLFDPVKGLQEVCLYHHRAFFEDARSPS